MQISLYKAESFTMYGRELDFAALVLSDPLEIEEGDPIEVVCGGMTVFEGDVSCAWTNNVGTQIIHAVATSVSSSGAEHSIASRILTDIRDISEYDRTWLLEELIRQYQLKGD